MKNEIEFDLEGTLQALRDGRALNGKDGVLTPLIKQLTEVAMPAELENNLAEDASPNRKNGRARKSNSP